jgi:DNA-binding MarR family transcriptional regulator
VQFVLLASLTWLQSPEPVTQKELAEHARTDPMMTSQVLRALESKGLIERRPHPGDARAKSLHVVPEGAELANRATAAVEAADRAYFASLGKDLPAFTRQLQRLSGFIAEP